MPEIHGKANLYYHLRFFYNSFILLIGSYGEVADFVNRTYSISELQTILSPIFVAHGVKRAVLFGPYAKGSATPRSDVDLLVDSGLRGLAFFGLLDSVASALDTPVDLIDTSQIERGSQIEQEVSKNGVNIFEQ